MTANKMFKEIGYKERSWERNNYDSEKPDCTITFDRRTVYISKLGIHSLLYLLKRYKRYIRNAKNWGGLNEV